MSDDPRVQLVRDILCGDDDPKMGGGDWESWIAKRIVDALCVFSGNPVGCLTVRRYRGINSMVNHEFDYYGDLPDGSYTLHISPTRAASAAPADEGRQRIEAALRNLIGAINAYEKATGIGGWYAEHMQEAANRLLKAHGSDVRFGLGDENPVATAPTMSEAVRQRDEWRKVLSFARGIKDRLDTKEALQSSISGYAYDAAERAIFIENIARAEIERIDRAAAKGESE